MRILNLGAGIQSTTIYLMMMKGEIEPADHAIFADTQEEPQAVYEHLKWLQSLNGVPIHVVTTGKLGDHVIHGNPMPSKSKYRIRYALLPVFIAAREGVKRSIGMRQCTGDYKIKPLLDCVKQELLGMKKGQRMKQKVTHVLGISLDESGRAAAFWKVANRGKS